LPKVPFDEQRRNVVQLLRDRKNDLQGVASFKDFEEMGPQQGGQWPFSAEYVKRAFGTPVDPKDPDSEYVEHPRGASHALMEKRLEQLRAGAWVLWKAVNEVYPRDEGGERDYDRLVELAARGNPDAKRLIFLSDLGVDLLTMYCHDDDLFVEFARRRTIKEEGRMEAANAAIAARYEDLKAQGKTEKQAAEQAAFEEGISVQSVRRIAEGQRLARGEQKRGPGRPRKVV
jgi:hypothetical protein